MIPNHDLNGLVLLDDKDFRTETKNFFKHLATPQQIPSAISTDAWVSACAGNRWVRDLLLESVPDRLTGSLQHLGTIFSALDHGDDMFSPQVRTSRGNTSWAALTYLAVRHSHDRWSEPWHHDFCSADAAWPALQQRLGDDVARQVCATIAFQNTLRTMLRSPPSSPLCEVGIYEPNKPFCNGRNPCLKKLKQVISASLGSSDPGGLYWRSCAYAALALKGRHHGSSTNATSVAETDEKIVNEFAQFAFQGPAQSSDCGLISFEYGSYLPLVTTRTHCNLWDNILAKCIENAIFRNGTPRFFSISLGRHWRTSDLLRLSDAICDNKFEPVLDPFPPSQPQWLQNQNVLNQSDLNRYIFCHVRLQDAFTLWLDARFP